MALASWVVKRQLMVVAASLRSAWQALMFLCRASSSGFRLLRQARATTLNSICHETADLVPNAWPLYDQLAATYLTLGRPEAALKPLEQSLAISEGHLKPRPVLIVYGE